MRITKHFVTVGKRRVHYLRAALSHRDEVFGNPHQ